MQAYGKRKQITRPDGDNAGDTPYVPLLEQYQCFGHYKLLKISDMYSFSFVILLTF